MIPDGLRLVHPEIDEGNVWLPAEAARAVAQRLHLHHRVRDVFECVLENLKDEAIARRLHIKPNTVKTYLRKLFRAIGVHSRHDVVLRALAENRRLLAENANWLAVSTSASPQEAAAP